jgi:hypothetical protein
MQRTSKERSPSILSWQAALCCPLFESYGPSQDAFSSTPDSILAHRIVADVFRQEFDYENAVKTAESGLELVRKAESRHGKKLKS